MFSSACNATNNIFFSFYSWGDLITNKCMIYDDNFTFPCCFVTRKKHLADDTSAFPSADIFSF